MLRTSFPRWGVTILSSTFAMTIGPSWTPSGIFRIHPLACMQSKLHAAVSESFRARNLPIPTLPKYKQAPRLAVEHGAPRPAWSCGTIAMCTTLHLLLGDRHPHELPGLHIIRTRMLTLHRALLEWLIAGTPPALWQIGCLHQDIHPLP